ncbi:MAG: hypothetical protein WC661_01560 [Opitutaceae bacterium]|jgi:hypothetical protein
MNFSIRELLAALKRLGLIPASTRPNAVLYYCAEVGARHTAHLVVIRDTSLSRDIRELEKTIRETVRREDID